MIGTVIALGLLLLGSEASRGDPPRPRRRPRIGSSCVTGRPFWEW